MAAMLSSTEIIEHVNNAEEMRPSGVFRAAEPAELAPRHKKRWTEEERGIVRAGWGIRPLSEIARATGRSESAVYDEAVVHMRLGGGRAQGFEYIAEAARRVGYSRNALLRILRWAHVNIWQAVSKPGSHYRNARMVDPYDVDQAVKAWCETETLSCASRRYGFAAELIREQLEAAEGRGEIKLPARRAGNHWRIPSVDIDKAMEDYLHREDIAEAAARHGLGRKILARWLREAGVVYNRHLPKRWLDPDFVDRVVRKKLRCEYVKEAAERHGVCVETMRGWLTEAGVGWSFHQRYRWLDPDFVDALVARIKEAGRFPRPRRVECGRGDPEMFAKPAEAP